VDPEHSARVLVCVPAYNESKNISNIVNKCKKYADEVIVYDDGSTDDTLMIDQIDWKSKCLSLF